MAISVRDATEADLPSIGLVSSLAFNPTTDAITRHIFPARLKPAANADIGDAVLPWRVARKAATLRGYHGARDGSRMMVAVDEEGGGQIVGVATWDAPEDDKKEKSEEEKEFDRLKHWYPNPPPEGVDHDAFMELRRVAGEGPKKTIGDEAYKTWNLDIFAIHPGYQRRGIGRKLIQAGLKHIADVSAASTEGDGSYNVHLVATPAGKPLYEAVGFEIAEELILFDQLHHSMMIRVGGRKS